MSAAFDACLAFTLREEGGFANDSRDRGGATKFGITRATLSRWRCQPCSVVDVQGLTESEARAIYQSWYWATVSGDDLPAGVNLMVFDEGVNTGEHEAAVLLQQAVNVVQDGEIGPITLAAVRAADRRVLIGKLSCEQESYYRACRDFPAFGTGWLARLHRRQDAALALARG